MTSEEDRPEHVLLRPGIDRIFESMSTRHRRLVLVLLEQGALDTITDVLMRGDTEADKLEITLTHNHLPKLADAGYIEWDQDTGEISKGPRFDEIEPLLELIQNHADELPPGWP